MSSPKNGKLRILVVDDEASIRDLMKIELTRLGNQVEVAADGLAAVKVLETHSFDAAIIDLRMPNMNGWDVIEHLKTVAPETEAIINTAHGDMEDAIHAIRSGVYDFLRKPFQKAELVRVLKRIEDKRTLTNKNIALERQVTTLQGNDEFIGSTSSMNVVKRLIEKVAPTDSSVLVLGETGTGKELVARRIHNFSPRDKMPFVAVNCGALPENLVESEFFGHRKGAFTGADTARKGLIEVAEGGTLFLDELGELDKSMQVKLLRFLESGEIRRVGENQAFHVDVRIVCATNRDLRTMVNEGSFREDLYFRVNTFEIRLPPLRERIEDIPELAYTLIVRHHKGKPVPRDIISPEALEVLQRHPWTGNVRELSNVLEHAVILAGTDQILPEHLPYSVKGTAASISSAAPNSGSATNATKTLREVEMEMIHTLLDKHTGDKPKVAAEMGISLKTLYNKLNNEHAKAAS